MKRMLCMLLILSFLLCGCSFFGEHISEPVTFYYPCSRYQEDLCCVIRTEEREATGHTGDLSYLLALYLMGPASDELTSPLHSGIKLLSVNQLENQISLELSDTDKILSDIEFSLAGACLTMTCLDIAAADSVTITSGSRTVTMDRGSISLFDGSTITAQEEESE